MVDTRERITVEARIKGQVQGVSFRFWTQDKAKRLGLAGWVRNEPDGSVTALFSGPRERVEEMLDRCREGPPAAKVESVEPKMATPAPEVTEFRIVG